MCPAHGEEALSVNGYGHTRCGECARIKRRVNELRGSNKKRGHHPREVLLKVPNRLLRERYWDLVSSGAMTVSEIAVAAGYIMKRNDRRGCGTQGDVQRLKKQLGLSTQYGKPDPVTGVRPAYLAETVHYDSAERLARAMGIEYLAEVGV